MKLLRRFLAAFRLNAQIVCEESNNPEHPRDYHDYHDAEEHNPKTDYPLSWFEYTCRRCGKKFTI